MRSSELFDVRDKIVLVTGAASGIGRAIAEAMAENGARVILADINGAGAESAAREMAGGKAAAVTLDIADRDQVNRVVDRIVAEEGRLDVAFANAGVSAGPSFGASPEGRLDRLSSDAWDRSLQINLTGTLETVRACARHMERQGDGRIIVTASISGMRASPVSGYAYVAAKAALINLVRHAAVELGPRNVLVNAIAPGFIVTNIAGGALKHDPETAGRLAAGVPVRRLGLPDELKGVALFLASSASSYITGTVIPVDGGVTAA